MKVSQLIMLVVLMRAKDERLSDMAGKLLKLERQEFEARMKDIVSKL